jgi:hypothetical protein
MKNQKKHGSSYILAHYFIIKLRVMLNSVPGAMVKHTKKGNKIKF